MPLTIGGQLPCGTCGNWPRLDRSDVRAYIVLQHDRHGYGWSTLADMLNQARVPTLAGGDYWRASSVKSLYDHPTRGQGGNGIR